jgi:hypothetical protein
MAKIFIPAVNKIREINRIVSFGCSMTAGEELMDEVRQQHKNISDELTIELKRKELSLAWPAQLAKLYDIPIYNFAESGSSFEKQIMQFIKAEEKNLIKDDTLILWGLTSMGRGVFFDEDYPNVCSYMLSNFNDQGIVRGSKDVRDFWYLRLNNDQHLYWKYYMCLQNMFYLANNFCNNQLLVIQGHAIDLKFRKSTLGNKYYKFINQYWKVIEPEYERYSVFKLGDPKECIGSWAFNNNMAHKYFHPTLEGHIKYAALIKEKLDSYNE